MTRPSLRRYLVPGGLLLALLGMALVFRGALVSWFSGAEDAPSASPQAAVSGANPPAPPASTDEADPENEPEPLPEYELPEPALEALKIGYEAYETIRSRLAADSLEGVSERSQRLGSSLGAAAQAMPDAPKAALKRIDEAAKAAEELSEITDIEAARNTFGVVSRTLVLLAGADRRLTEGRLVFRCPMTKGYPKWIQTNEKLENPYMGQKMLECGSESRWVEPLKPKTAVATSHEHGDEIAHYTCPMHPSVQQAGPGKCPICGMDLTPVTREELETGVVIVDAARRQLIGVKTTEIVKRKVEKSVRTVGRIAYDETRLTDVTLKYKGFIGKLYANALGEQVKRGYPLFTVYSPEVYAAQMEYLTALGSRSGSLGALGEGQRQIRHLAEIARDRLRLWDIPSATIDQIAEARKPQKYVPIVSPASGYIVEKNVVEGSAIEPGARLFRIANLDKVWIEADLYESELPLVEVGQSASISLPYVPNKVFEGKVTFVFPYLEGKTRTGRARIELDNSEVQLRPEMYANVTLQIDLGERLVVPESAVIYAGPRRLVFVDLGEGKLRPQTIEVGLKLGDEYEVTSGLSPGDRVVSSGNFLIAAESRLKSAEGKW